MRLSVARSLLHSLCSTSPLVSLFDHPQGKVAGNPFSFMKSVTCLRWRMLVNKRFHRVANCEACFHCKYTDCRKTVGDEAHTAHLSLISG